MRRAAKVDDNQRDIVQALRQIGATVQPLSAVGDGVPDLLVGYRALNILIEVKDGAKPKSKQNLTMEQETWHARWLGQVVIINNTEDAINYVRRLERDI